MASESLTVLIPRSRLLELTNRVATLEAERAVQCGGCGEWMPNCTTGAHECAHAKAARLAATQEGSATDA